MNRFRELARRDVAERIPGYARRLGRSPVPVELFDAPTRIVDRATHPPAGINWRTVVAPPPVVDHVVVHALAPRSGPHAESFQELVARHAPAFDREGARPVRHRAPVASPIVRDRTTDTFIVVASRGRSVTDRTIRVTVETADGDRAVVEAEPGRNLRDLLHENGISPYTAATKRLNCGGRGICATCGVRIEAAPDPEHWHDRLADRFGYPRLSCQVAVEEDVVVRIPEKLVWGRREPD